MGTYLPHTPIILLVSLERSTRAKKHCPSPFTAMLGPSNKKFLSFLQKKGLFGLILLIPLIPLYKKDFPLKNAFLPWYCLDCFCILSDWASMSQGDNNLCH